MKAFCVDDFQVEGVDAGRAFQRQIQASNSIFAEHQVLPVGQGEGLFVGALHGGLHGGAEGGFGGIDQLGQRQLLAAQLDAQLRAAALAVGRGDDAVGAAEPGQHIGMLQRRVAEIFEKLLLNQLPGEGRRARAG